ncbi:unnamed protein product [Linum trigynum]|uniref:CCHC-type domain-containing protein n=1 Tax=Linum trigynum TaxID=586398 RepID=A0AAV2CNN3_9ROSI
MLSTVVNENPLPAPTLFPSDRPPDTAISISDPSPCSNLEKAIISDTDMIVESPEAQPQSTQAPEISLAAQIPQSGDPPPLNSYASVVTGLKSPIASLPATSLWTPVGENDLIPGERNGEPALKISTEFKNRICAPWQRALVVRLLGRKIGFPTLCSRLRSLWRPVGSMEVMDLDFDCFLVKLDNEQDYFRALTDGPWVIFDHYLVVQQWTPKFKVSDPLPKKMIVWVQLPALKVHFYHKEVLITLGNLIGRTIKLDFHTLNRQRAKFSRLAVEVDLGKHLVPRIWLDEEWQKVEYENLPTVCFECGKIGHMSTECPQLLPPVAPVIGWTLGGAATASTPATEPEEHPGFGPWMLVSRKSRRDPRAGTSKGKSNFGNGGVIPTPAIKKGKEGAVSKGTDPHDNGDKPSHILKPQEGKGGNGKKSGEEVRKGKEKAVYIPAGSDKGLLGPGPKESGLHRDEHSFNVSKNEEIQIREGAREENFTDQVQPSEAAASMVAHEGQEIKIQVPRCIAHSPRDYRMDRGESSETRRVDSCG